MLHGQCLLRLAALNASLSEMKPRGGGGGDRPDRASTGAPAGGEMDSEASFILASSGRRSKVLGVAGSRWLKAAVPLELARRTGGRELAGFLLLWMAMLMRVCVADSQCSSLVKRIGQV